MNPRHHGLHVARLVVVATIGLLAMATLAVVPAGAAPQSLTDNDAGRWQSRVPSVGRVTAILPGLAGARRSVGRTELAVPQRSSAPGEDLSCDPSRLSTRRGLLASYGDGGDYIDQYPVALRVFAQPSRRAAARILREVRRSVRQCATGVIDEYQGYGEARIREVTVPRRAGRLRFGYRVFGPYQHREVRMFAVSGKRLLDVTFDGDVAGERQVSWRFKSRGADASLALLRRTAR